MTHLDQYRLPRSVVPMNYRLVLEPDLHNASFVGSVDIAVQVATRSNELTLNSLDLQIHNASVSVNGIEQTAAVSEDEDAERISLLLEDELNLGEASIHIEFSGLLNDKLLGFYRSTYVDPDGTPKTLATTQFESTNARRAFPCFDEPDFKATFDVALVIDPSLEAVSCGPTISDTNLEDGRRQLVFGTTMLMSTYLLAFIVGDLEYSETVDAGGTPLRIVHVPGKGHLTEFALETGAFALTWLAEYYGIPYPGEKLDMIAVPDFAFGAMENLGCVTYRETLLLVDPQTTPEAELVRVADVISHELAHMWFGDLVTMKWWNGIWLKEAFATFMEMATVNAMRPDWRRWEQFGQSRSGALAVDSLLSTRAIEFEVNSPAEAEGMYDTLTYEKGAAVVRMLEQYLGGEEFRKAITFYLKKYSYANTENEDLWTAIEQSTSEPVQQIAESWIFQGGFPLITIESVNETTIQCSQSRLLLDSGLEADDRLWHVPITLRAGTPSGIVEKRFLLGERQSMISFYEPVHWVVANAGGDGFYRVAYDEDLLIALQSDLQSILAPLERHNLVDDAWTAVHAGKSSAISFLELVESFSNETDLGVWKAISHGVKILEHLIEESDLPRFRGRIANLGSTALDFIGIEPLPNEDSQAPEVRAVLLDLASDPGQHKESIALAARIHDQSQTDPTSIDPNLASAAMGIVASNGNAGTYQAFVGGFKNSTTPQLEIRYLYALAKFPGATEFESTLAMSLSNKVRTQNAPFLLGRCLMNSKHGTRAWEFIEDNWETINTRLPSNSIVRMLEGIKSIYDPEQAARVNNFFGDHEVAQGEMSLTQHLEMMNINVALRHRECKILGEGL